MYGLYKRRYATFRVVQKYLCPHKMYVQISPDEQVVLIIYWGKVIELQTQIP